MDIRTCPACPLALLLARHSPVPLAYRVVVCPLLGPASIYVVFRYTVNKSPKFLSLRTIAEPNILDPVESPAEVFSFSPGYLTWHYSSASGFHHHQCRFIFPGGVVDGLTYGTDEYRNCIFSYDFWKGQNSQPDTMTAEQASKIVLRRVMATEFKISVIHLLKSGWIPRVQRASKNRRSPSQLVSGS